MRLTCGLLLGQKSPVVIGVTGPNAAGKGEVCRILSAVGYTAWSLSDIVREVARSEDRDVSRETLIEIGQRLRRERGPGVLAEMILPRIGPQAVVDSIRAPAEVAVLRRLASFRLLGVIAPLDVRWRRAVARGREGDAPDQATFAAREERENQDHPDSQQLRRTLELADAVVTNDGGLHDLRERVLEVVGRWERAPGGSRVEIRGDDA